MEKSFTWRKGAFKRTTEIYSGEMLAGTMKEYYWKESAHAEIGGRAFYFKTRGFFERKTEVMVVDSNEMVATITYNKWSSKATVIRSDKPYNKMLWKFDNFWNTKASLTDASGRSVRYHGGHFKGSVTSTLDDELLILAGLFIMSHMRRRTASIAAAS